MIHLRSKIEDVYNYRFHQPISSFWNKKPQPFWKSYDIIYWSITIVRIVIKINFASIFTIRKLKIISGCVEIYNGLILIPKLPKLHQNCQNWLYRYLEMYPVLAFISVYLLQISKVYSLLSSFQSIISLWINSKN